MILKRMETVLYTVQTAKISDSFMETVGNKSDDAIEIYLRPTLVATVTKLWEF